MAQMGVHSVQAMVITASISLALRVGADCPISNKSELGLHVIYCPLTTIYREITLGQSIPLSATNTETSELSWRFNSFLNLGVEAPFSYNFNGSCFLKFSPSCWYVAGPKEMNNSLLQLMFKTGVGFRIK
jgi:hypothetical protein